MLQSSKDYARAISLELSIKFRVPERPFRRQLGQAAGWSAAILCSRRSERVCNGRWQNARATKIPIAAAASRNDNGMGGNGRRALSETSVHRSNQFKLLAMTPAPAGVDLVVAFNSDGPMHACDDQHGRD
jgi:hypothetical protein